MQLVCPSCATKNRLPDTRLLDEPKCGRCGTQLAPMEPIGLDDGSLGRYLEGTDVPVLVDFWAEWCGPCKVIAPQFKAAAAQLPGVRFVKVDTEAAPRSGMRHQVRSIPTLVLFQRGVEVARRSGVVSANEIAVWLKSAGR